MGKRNLKNKKWLVCLSCQEYDEIEITAKSKSEAKRKAQKIMDENPEYMEMEIDDIGLMPK